MRWDGQKIAAEAAQALPGLALAGHQRSVRTPEFAGVTFHEVHARSALNKVPEASAMPFRWTVNPMRGCLHACTYCFARPTHEYLGLGPDEDFQTQIVVKTNVVEVLAAELRRASWRHEHVALGTNTDPYQRAEGRYALMPGIIGALAHSGTPMSLLTKGTLLRRDIPLLADAAQEVGVSVAVSLAIGDEALQQAMEPGTPTPRARLGLIRAVREAGLECGVLVAPVMPWLTDSTAHLDGLFRELAEAGASWVTTIPLHLRGPVRPLMLSWLAEHRPELVPNYRRLYAKGAYVPEEYRRWLSERVRPLRRRHGLHGPSAAPLEGAGSPAGAGAAGAAGGAGAAASAGPGAAQPSPWRVRAAGDRSALATPEGALAGALAGAVQPALF
ncbi:Rv2578c family radical SAM protein [Cellulomonas pakistanensis]|uniref:Radical SAM protein n=1 Tax=Cellulomonas pakistanensis TaxID=992287 RepID=A0A919PG23_9CELL|nr:Rv2578c family radical SAM protein [Cellulomonas pakistanensis]GIG38209.1 radical SAM protein [Cellulomonas pakistanensis]